MVYCGMILCGLFGIRCGIVWCYRFCDITCYCGVLWYAMMCAVYYAFVWCGIPWFCVSWHGGAWHIVVHCLWCDMFR